MLISFHPGRSPGSNEILTMAFRSPIEPPTKSWLLINIEGHVRVKFLEMTDGSLTSGYLDVILYPRLPSAVDKRQDFY